jgi:hypothetical protein
MIKFRANAIINFINKIKFVYLYWKFYKQNTFNL